MPITLTCGCGKKLRIDDRFAGQKGRCPACGQTIDIPAEDQPPPPPPPQVRPVPPPLPQEAYTGPEEVLPQVTLASPAAEPVADAPLTNHGGGDIPEDADFFIDPPPEIGLLTSAHTNMRQGDEPWSPAARTSWCVLGAAIGVLIGVLLAILTKTKNPGLLALWPLGLGAIGPLIPFLLTRFKRRCTYVGREGLARFVCTGHRDKLGTAEVFLFRDAMALRTAQTRHYTNGAYQGTNYSFTWTDIAGVKRYVISGRHNSEKGTPALTHEYYYAAAAEFAWTLHLLGQMEAKLTLGGAVTFNLNQHDWVRVSPGHLRFSFKGDTIDCPVEEIGQARVDQGMFIIKRVDAREGWFSSEGVFKFPYSQLANAQLFLILLDKVAGVRLN